MSNALKRKKKPMFYTKQEMKTIGRNDFEKRNADKVVTKSYKDFVAIGYIVLRDLFGFGQKRIIRLQEEMKARLETAADGGVNGAHVGVALKSKYGIDVDECVKRVPQRQLMILYAQKGRCIEREAYRITCASMFNYLAFTLITLKQCFKLSVNQLQQFIDKFIEYIDVLSNYKQFQLTVPMIAQSLADEIKFICDLEA